MASQQSICEYATQVALLLNMLVKKKQKQASNNNNIAIFDASKIINK